LIGYAERDGETVAVYSVDKCIEVLMADGTDYEDARDHFYNNLEGSWSGDKTPVWVHRLTLPDCIRLGLPDDLAEGL
jgi:hypothetical protein